MMSTVVNVKEIGIFKDQVLVFFQLGILKEKIKQEIIVTIKKFFEKPELTHEVRNYLCKEVSSWVEVFFNLMIEVFIDSP